LKGSYGQEEDHGCGSLLFAPYHNKNNGGLFTKRHRMLSSHNR